MRIAIFLEAYLPSINGVITHVKILKEGLENKGHDVLIVTAAPGSVKHTLKDGILYCPAVKLKKKHYGYGMAMPVSNTRQRAIAAFKPDVIHVHNEFGVCLSGIIAAKILKIPLVYTLHTLYDDYVHYIALRYFTNQAKLMSRKYVKFLAERADIITGPSKKCGEYLEAAGCKKEVNVIPNSVELELFTPENISWQSIMDVKAKLNLPSEAFLACFVGRLGAEKSLDVLIEYWAQSVKSEDNMYLVIIGDGPAKPELEILATRLGIIDNVKFMGTVAHHEIPPYYAVCDVFATASLSEMYSISMLEAMASGLAVVQRLDPSNRDQIKDGVNGFIYKTAEEMADLLREIKAKTLTERAELKRSVIESVQRQGSEAMATYMLDIYERATAAKRTKRVVKNKK